MTLLSLQSRAIASQGRSAEAIYRMVRRVLLDRHTGRGTLVDIGCGSGALWSHAQDLFDRYVGIDAVAYAGFPRQHELLIRDLDAADWQLAALEADVVAAVETIEHLENPRAFLRQLAALARPRGLIIVTTPNQLSLLSKLTLLMKNQFNAFQEAPGLYPAHRTALLEIDLIRIARETHLSDVQIAYSNQGRIPGTRWHWPKLLRGRMFSDNVLMSAIQNPLPVLRERGG